MRSIDALRLDTHDKDGLLVIADVHGHARAFADLIAFGGRNNLFVVQLGDLVDRGPDSIGAIELARDLIDSGSGLVIRGNHEHKLVRVLVGKSEATNPWVAATALSLMASRRARAAARWLIRSWDRFPYTIRLRRAVMVHGALTPESIPPARQLTRKCRNKALFGEIIGMQSDGMPIRGYGWLDRLPAGLLVIAGHDPLSGTCLYLRTGRGGARLLHLDAGAGQGGPLAAAVLDPEGRIVRTIQWRDGKIVDVEVVPLGS